MICSITPKYPPKYPPVEIKCNLNIVKKIGDTTIATIKTKGCNVYNFDTTADGIWKIFSSDMTTPKEIIAFKNGKKNGMNIKYYDNGKVEIKEEYKAGKRNGAYYYIDKDGTYVSEGSYVPVIKGEEYLEFSGTTTTFWNNASIAKQIIEVNDSTVSSEFWDKEGNVIDEKRFNKLWYDCK